MKTTRFLAAIMVVATLSLGSVNASEKSSAAVAKQNLSEQIRKVFNTTPFDDLINQPTERITVVFRINQNHEFELIKVLGENKELTRYSTLVLSEKSIHVDPNLEAKAYYMPLKFECR
jgi:hypothetical protein